MEYTKAGGPAGALSPEAARAVLKCLRCRGEINRIYHLGETFPVPSVTFCRAALHLYQELVEVEFRGGGAATMVEPAGDTAGGTAGEDSGRINANTATTVIRVTIEVEGRAVN
jgi:hypothetical protein